MNAKLPGETAWAPEVHRCSERHLEASRSNSIQTACPYHLDAASWTHSLKGLEQNVCPRNQLRAPTKHTVKALRNITLIPLPPKASARPTFNLCADDYASNVMQANRKQDETWRVTHNSQRSLPDQQNAYSKHNLNHNHCPLPTSSTERTSDYTLNILKMLKPTG